MVSVVEPFILSGPVLSVVERVEGFIVSLPVVKWITEQTEKS
ncbi:MAG: hypothetical protein PHY02_04865 [Phycisphaerae bacterium]|nr:hypothetical protein [Phycisphaerae bacterium]